MAGLLYREDVDEARKRMAAWLAGGDIGRPAMHVGAWHLDDLVALKKAFGPKVKSFLIGFGAKDKAEGERALAFMEC